MSQVVTYTIGALDTKRHNRAHFHCAEPSLTEYLQRIANQDQKRHVASSFVLTTTRSERILGFYTLSASAVDLNSLPEVNQKKLPRYRLIPAYLIGRLAVHADEQGKGHGKRLLVDALRRAQRASVHEASGAFVIVDALHEKAAAFYEAFGFQRLTEPSQLFLPIQSVPQNVA